METRIAGGFETAVGPDFLVLDERACFDFHAATEAVAIRL
jgi:hypothetical protein